jgi:hypothetical protein
MRSRTKTREKVVYWARLGTDPDGGGWLYAPPVELTARWEDGQTDVQGDGNVVWKSSSQVMFVFSIRDGEPEVDIREGGYIWRGKFSRLASTTLPTNNANAAQIQRVGRVPTRRNRQLFVTAYL